MRRRRTNRAFDAAGAVHAFWREVFGRDSIDGRGMHLIGSVHYRNDYDNAFWDGAQMVYGDGDGIVIAALAESLADVFGSLVKQHAAGQTLDEADWLIGSQLFTENVAAIGLRSLRRPGYAYDDPALGGRDPQVAHMRDYVHRRRDDGGVHLNSGIPNHDFISSRMPSADTPGIERGTFGMTLCGRGFLRAATLRRLRTRRERLRVATVRRRRRRCATRGLRSASPSPRMRARTSMATAAAEARSTSACAGMSSPQRSPCWPTACRVRPRTSARRRWRANSFRPGRRRSTSIPH